MSSNGCGERVPSETATPRPQAARLDLESDDPRRRLAACSLLSRLCCESKPRQHAVGAFLREPSSDGAPPRRLAEIVLADLQASDRTLRCAAARLLCLATYENLVNQEAVMQLAKGFSLGWLHVFSVPPAYRTAAATNESAQLHSQRGLAAFLQQIVSDQYGQVYATVSSYYADACRAFLPLCWRYPPRDDSNDGDADDDVPDPADHVLGFYLVPRQAQFPEPDAFYVDELLQTIEKDELPRLQAAKAAFERCCADGDAGAPTNEVLLRAFTAFCRSSDDDASLEWLVRGDVAAAAAFASLEGFVGAAATATLSWESLFVFVAQRLHGEKLIETFGGAALTSLASVFRESAFTPCGSCVASSTYAWLPVLVDAVRRHSELPPPLKRQVQSLLRGSPLSSHSASQPSEPWRVLLHTKLEQVTPVSWAVFLAQWRAAKELERRLGDQQHAAAPTRRTSVCSVTNLRRSIVEQLQPRSVRDLDQLRRALPVVSRLASHPDLSGGSSQSLPIFREERNGDTEDDDAGDGEDAATPLRLKSGRPLDVEDARALFHRMQHSLAELDALSLRTLHEKQQEKQRVLWTVSLNKRRAEEDAARRRLEADARQREVEAKQVETQLRMDAARAKSHKAQQRKHEEAARRKLERDAEVEAWQQELADRIGQRDLEREAFVRRKQQDEKRAQQALTQAACEEASRPTRPPATQPRPQSARAAVSVAAPARDPPSPELLRQRAQLYGQVVSRIYVSEAVSRGASTAEALEPAAYHQPHHLTRSFSMYRASSFNVKAPVVKLAPPAHRHRTPRYRRPLKRGASVHAEPNDQEATADDEDDNEQQRKEDDVREAVTPRARRLRVGGSTATTPRSSRTSTAAESPRDANACATLVMRNAALAVSERISIPDVPAPHVEDPTVPPYVVAAQYEALADHHKLTFRRRFNLKCVSHRLSFAVLRQYTQIVRRDMAWQAFHDKSVSHSGSGDRVRYNDFVGVAQALGVVASEKKLLVTARQLDKKKSGSVEWKAFYTWWCMQYDDYAAASASATAAADAQGEGKPLH